jgi:hypothetical protein
VPTVLKSGSLNLLERSGPAQACNGIALPLLVLHMTQLNAYFIIMLLLATSFGLKRPSSGHYLQKKIYIALMMEF